MTTAAELASYASSFPSFRNRIINGDMRIDQRNAGAVVTNNGEYPVDRWVKTGNPSASLQRSTIAPDGYTNSLLTTITATGDSSSTLRITHHIEGFNVSNLGWGSSNAKPVTVSFMVRSSVAGTYSVRLSNSAGDRVYFGTFTIILADTWEYKSVTISGDTTGTWLTDNGRGITISFVLAGSTAVTPNAWGTTGTSATGQTNLCLTNGATFYITGVQLEEGTVATPFEHRPISVELSLAQRYYTNYQDNFLSAKAYSTIDGDFICNPLMYSMTMRATPTITVFDIAGASGKAHIQYVGSGGGSNETVTVITLTNKGFAVSRSSGVGNDKYGAIIFKYNADSEL